MTSKTSVQDSVTKSDKTVLPPVADKIPYEIKTHEEVRIDDYYWMRDDSRSDPKVIEHLNLENRYADHMLSDSKDLQDKIFEEINSRLKKDDSTVPVFQRGYFYYRQFNGDMEYPVYIRKNAENGQEEILLDGNKMAEGKEYFAIGRYSISTNNNILAYSTDTISRRLYTIEFRDLTTDKMLDDKLENTSGQIVWANDNQTVFYIKKDLQTLLGYQVYRHKIGTPQSEDVLVYEEKDNTFYTGIGKTKDDALIYVYHSHTQKKGASYIDANKPESELIPFYPIEDGHEYSFQKNGDWFYVRTNWNAKNFRIMKTKIEDSQNRNKWQEVIAHNPDVFIQDYEVLKDYLVLAEKEQGKAQIRRVSLSTLDSNLLEFDDPVFVAMFTGNVNLETNKVRLFYSSMTTPSTYYDYDLDKQTRELLKQDEVLGGFHPSNYQSERISARSRDGVDIPVSIVYRKDKFKKDGTNPLYQYAYGSYGSSTEPYFSSSMLSLLDRGFVFVRAHVRGGQELGRHWYEDGKMFNKKNTFNDFIDVTKTLVEQKYGDPKRIFASGGSAGGLLIGAVINQAPELYLGVGAHVPFVDVVTTMLDESIPLTTNEFNEWGNPKNKDSYDYMLSYSPYDQVKKQDYPNILVTTGLHDSQVQYFEPAKWVAKLRDYKTDSNRLIFKTNMDAGHGGSSGRFRRNKERALEYAFFSSLAGINE
ncbi:S9 family peptidase [Aliikangiella marina]|nr:S9 family peptidase [Aliikangiella marina]